MLLLSLPLTDAMFIELLYLFWLPAHVAHLIGSMIANRNDIFIDWRIFFLGDLAGWGLLCGFTALVLYLTEWPIWVLWVYYGIHILIISTIMTDSALYQETLSVSSVGKIITETLVESMLIPWVAGFAVGILSVWIFGF